MPARRSPPFRSRSNGGPRRPAPVRRCEPGVTTGHRPGTAAPPNGWWGSPSLSSARVATAFPSPSDSRIEGRAVERHDGVVEGMLDRWRQPSVEFCRHDPRRIDELATLALDVPAVGPPPSIRSVIGSAASRRCGGSAGLVAVSAIACSRVTRGIRRSPTYRHAVPTPAPRPPRLGSIWGCRSGDHLIVAGVRGRFLGEATSDGAGARHPSAPGLLVAVVAANVSDNAGGCDCVDLAAPESSRVRKTGRGRVWGGAARHARRCGGGAGGRGGVL
jgi:hypothetical protein